MKYGKKLILPCRHPYRVEESYTRKGDSGFIPVMIEAYETLINDFAPLTDLWLCVDSPHREKQLKHLKKSLKLPLETEWEVVHSQSSTWRMKLEDFTPSKQVINLVERHKDFFGRFYELV